jgi:hypothetical protein
MTITRALLWEIEKYKQFYKSTDFQFYKPVATRLLPAGLSVRQKCRQVWRWPIMEGPPGGKTFFMNDMYTDSY